MPRGRDGRFLKPEPLKAVQAPSEPIDWNAIYEWRDAWVAHLRRQEDLKREERFGGLRSIAIFSLMSAVLVGMLIAGVNGG